MIWVWFSNVKDTLKIHSKNCLGTPNLRTNIAVHLNYMYIF